MGNNQEADGEASTVRCVVKQFGCRMRKFTVQTVKMVLCFDTVQVFLSVFCGGTNSSAAEEAKDAAAAAGKDF